MNRAHQSGTASTPDAPQTRRRRACWRAPRLACALMLIVVCGASAPLVSAGDISIDRASAAIENEIVTLNSDASFEFSEDAIEALKSGITLNFELEIRILEARRFWWDKNRFVTQRRYSLERHALSEQYILQDLITGDRRIHASIGAAIDDLGRIRSLPVLDATDIGETQSLDIRMRFRLEIESLPAPMIPIAYISPGWRMSSGWHRWQASL